jgi:predicted DsbA family dithiol-disulfide isomerase
METKQLEIIEFTDPVCTWCWGSEPVLRTLEARYADKIKIGFIMGGLVKDITAFYDSHNEIGGDPELSNQSIAAHWLEASERHGMPVKVEGFKLFTKDQPSTYPQNIAYKAAQMQDEVKADRFLRRMREASAAEALQTNLTEVLVELASEVGLDIGRFLEDFTGGKAKTAFEEDLYTTAQFRAHGFPTFLVKYGEKSMLLRGYQNYNTFKTVINQLTNGEIQEMKPLPTEDNVLEFINKNGSLASIEIKMPFDLSDAELDKIINSLQEKKLVAKREAGNGYFIFPLNNPMMCDVDSGMCGI